MARDKQIAVAFEPGAELPLVKMNQESIERVIINLVTNAIKYTPIGGKITISAVHERPAKEVRLDITDTGIGIPEECLPQIFDRFFRVERKVHTIKGTGLGLTIVKSIVEEHGGRVSVTSSLGHGSTFTIFLPAELPAEISVAVQEETVQAAGDTGASRPTAEINIS